jgi:hypothetical protein
MVKLSSFRQQRASGGSTRNFRSTFLPLWVLLALINLSLLPLVRSSTVGDSCLGDATLCNTPGHYCDAVLDTCQLVLSNYYSNGDGVARACGVGYTTLSAGAGAGLDARVACICRAGYGRSSNNDICERCVMGYFKLTTGDTLCTACAPGKFYDIDNAVFTPELDQCDDCASPAYTSLEPGGATGTDSQDACICSIGYGRSSGYENTACELCVAGFYKTEANNDACTKAPAPRKSPNSGTIEFLPRTDYWYFDKIEPAISSSSEVLKHVKIAFIVGLLTFMLLLIVQKLRGLSAFAGPDAAHASLAFARLLVLGHVAASGVLLYWTVQRPVPIAKTSWPRILVGTRYEMSWLHHLPRPVIAILSISLGVGAAYHPVPAILCILGSLLELIECTISAVEVRDYITQALVSKAPLCAGWITTGSLMAYYYRDLVSVALVSALLLSVFHVMILVGYVGPVDETEKERLLTYDLVDRGHLDRTGRMREQRSSQLAKRVLGSRLAAVTAADAAAAAARDQNYDNGKSKANGKSGGDQGSLGSASASASASLSRLPGSLLSMAGQQSAKNVYWGEGEVSSDEGEDEAGRLQDLDNSYRPTVRSKPKAD